MLKPVLILSAMLLAGIGMQPVAHAQSATGNVPMQGSIGMSGAAAGPAVDSDGCYAAAENCLAAAITWQDDDTLKADYTNQCGARILLRYCHDREDGTRQCGESGLANGDVLSVVTLEAAGSVRYRWLGSASEVNDRLCISKLPDWPDGEF